MPLPFFPSVLSPAGVAEVSYVLYAQVDFPDVAPLIHLYILTLLCVCCQTSAAPLAAGAPRSGERSQETVWPPSVNYVFTARPGSHWACSAQYVSPAAHDKGSDVGVDHTVCGVDSRLQWRHQILHKKYNVSSVLTAQHLAVLSGEEKKYMLLLAAWCKISTYHSA